MVVGQQLATAPQFGSIFCFAQRVQVCPSSDQVISGSSWAGSSMLLQKLKIDDPVDAVPVHGFCLSARAVANGLASK